MTGKGIVCPRCGRRYSSKGNMICHLRFQCGLSPMFKCPIFTSVFFSRKVSAHTRKHNSGSDISIVLLFVQVIKARL